MVPPILSKYLKGATNQETKISKIKFLIVKQKNIVKKYC